MKRTNYIIFSILLVFASLLQGCNDEESGLSKAVLASAGTLNFEATGTSEKIITVYADADWVTEVPEWVTVTPVSGTGTMDVTITVTENIRGGAVDNPRKAALVFKGGTLASRAEVIISQDGDKYRDCEEYTLAELADLENETVVIVPQVIVTAVTTKGFIVSDGTVNIFMQSSSAVSVGDNVSVKGTKLYDTHSLPYVECDEANVNSAGSTVTYPAATDITDEVDTYTSTSRTFITVNGILNGNNVTVEGANYSVAITDAPENFDLAPLNGHKVKATGYFAGVAAPVIKLNATAIEDLGVVEIIYFAEDFEWLNPWAEASAAGRTVETDNLGSTAPQISSSATVVDGITANDALLQEGYQFLRVTPTSTEAGECIYLQNNYLKFGKTGYQAGIVLPKIEDIPAGVTTALSFDWCPMRQGSGKIDPVNLIVIVTNGSEEVTFDVPESGFETGHVLEWVRAEIELTGVTINNDTKITIHATQWQVSTANRWFLDNIKLIKAN
ncbi:BACON domain-containing protein [Maribellus sp. CM-23]|uniref:BACON domain-containing protein n=1 Tax=Maribellus sp. CM-23 TaxID=2781026 RepID=UPI001F42FDB9|nr:BACON domain-containing protein [Maribellus sp. CM-23]MCE4563851.1 BACON domain-containing protein [Maribellus sp. CM-23]